MRDFPTYNEMSKVLKIRRKTLKSHKNFRGRTAQLEKLKIIIVLLINEDK